VRHIAAAVLISVVLSAVVGVHSATAQVSDTKNQELKAWHRRAGGFIVEGEARPKGPVGPNEHFFMRAHGRFDVVVLDTNPFLFTYSAAKGPSTPSPNQQAAEAFLKAAGSLGGMLPAMGKGAPPLTQIDDLDIDKLRKSISDSDTNLKSLGAKIDQSLAISGETAEAYETEASKFRAQFTTWPAIFGDMTSQFGNLDRVLLKCGENPDAAVTTNNGAAKCSDEQVRTIVGPLHDAKDTALAKEAVLKSFYEDLNKLKPFRSDPVDYESTDTSITITAKANTKYSVFLTEAGKGEQAAGAGDLRLPLRAYSRFDLIPGPALVYSWVRNPTFSIVAEGDKFRIVTTSEPFSAYSVGAMLNIVPRRWEDPGLTGLFQVGITPVKDKIGIFGGAAIVLVEKVTIGVGFMRQQVNALADGTGPLIDSPDRLKLKTTWKSGAYLTFTYKP
jgi:hypothetical protein